MTDRPHPHILVFANQKGGVGKTSLSLNVAGALVHMNRSALLVDLDPQRNLSLSFPLPEDAETVLDVFTGKAPKPTKITDILAVLPSHRDLSGLAVRMATDMELLFRLKEYLVKQTEYEFIILDTPPTLSGLTLAAFAAATDLVVVLSTHFYTVHGTQDLLGLYAMVNKHINPDLHFLGAAIAICDRRTTLSREIAAIFNRDLGGKVFKICIPRSIKVEEAQAMRKPVTYAFPFSDIAELYKELAREIQVRLYMKDNPGDGEEGGDR